MEGDRGGRHVREDGREEREEGPLTVMNFHGFSYQVKDLDHVMYVACGSRDAQTLAAVENGQLWAWGDGSYGKLGKKDLKESLTPVLVEDFGEDGIAQLECGTQFSVLLTKSGKVYTWCVWQGWCALFGMLCIYAGVKVTTIVWALTVTVM